jgi:hypothetical protein
MDVTYPRDCQRSVPRGCVWDFASAWGQLTANREILPTSSTTWAPATTQSRAGLRQDKDPRSVVKERVGEA